MVKNQDLHAFGAAYSKIDYEGTLDWFLQFSSIEHVWKYHPTYLVVHFLFIFGGLATLCHALIRGGRLPYLWLGTVLHGLVVESLCYILPDVDNFWHSQTPIMFFGRRLPVHIVFLYPCFIYQSSIGVAKLKLSRWAEPFAVGLGSVLVDTAYDIISVNFLHWTWHDTDPNIYDRFYWVPWNSFYFHSCFAASFTFWFHFTRKLICKTEKWEADTFVKEIICTLLAGFLGTPGGVLMFIPIYHPLHDIFKLHSEPENEIAIGLAEPIGPCDEYLPIQTAFGLVLKKRKYLCATDYDEKYFNWDCLPDKKPPPYGSIWYTACGVPAPNMVEFSAIAICFAVVGLTVYGNLHFNSFGDDVFKTSRQISGSSHETLTKKKNK
ncbi:hypothetical protein Trydic_g17175 [Trypoxylus dichotomus]